MKTLAHTGKIFYLENMAQADNSARLPSGDAARDAMAAFDRCDPLRGFREAFVIRRKWISDQAS